MESAEEGDGHENCRQKQKGSFVIKIPSYEEVIEGTQSKTTPSLFNPSPSFTQAFNFIKTSEFYTPPPPPSATASQPLPTTTTASSQIGDFPSTSSSSAALATPTVASSSSSSFSAQPGYNRNTILVSHRQKGNPLLKHIRNVRWAFADVVCDYLLGHSACALYLSLRYHLLHPDYLYYRIRELQKNFKLRVVLCHIDVEDVVKPLLEVTRTALLHDCTLLCGWSLEECGRYLETIKVYENKPADIIQGQMDTDYLSRLNHALTAVRHVNKTDVVTLGSTFGSLSHIIDASMEDLARCPGIGDRKVKRLYDTFHEPFKRVATSRPFSAENPTQNNAEHNSTGEVKDNEKKVEDENKQKKEPELTVKSALSAAVEKYQEKVGKRNSKLQLQKGEEIGVAPGKTKNKSFGESAAD